MKQVRLLISFAILGTIMFLFQTNVAVAQTDSTKQNQVNLLDDLISDQEQAELLPPKFLITQHIFWGKKGLLRNFKRFELTPENRARELKLRRTMLVTHQVLGIATLCGMVGQGIVGSQLYKKSADGTLVKDKKILPLHEGLAAAVNIGYFTTAGLSLLAPPRMVSERKGYSSIKMHKILAMVHLSSMIAVNVLAGQAKDAKIRPWHRAAAFTAFGSYAVAMAVIKF
jgi:hypothetical protein